MNRIIVTIVSNINVYTWQYSVSLVMVSTYLHSRLLQLLHQQLLLKWREQLKGLLNSEKKILQTDLMFLMIYYDNGKGKIVKRVPNLSLLHRRQPFIYLLFQLLQFFQAQSAEVLTQQTPGEPQHLNVSFFSRLWQNHRNLSFKTQSMHTIVSFVALQFHPSEYPPPWNPASEKHQYKPSLKAANKHQASSVRFQPKSSTLFRIQ